MKSISYSLVSAILTAALVLGAADPFAGTWKLNVQKSKFPADVRPKAMTIEMESTGKGVRYESHSEFANGKKSMSAYAADYDGPQALVRGATGFLAPVTLKKIDSHTVEAIYSRGLTLIATSKRVVSQDGRTMTITTVSKDKAGKEVTTVGVYERVAGNTQSASR